MNNDDERDYEEEAANQRLIDEPDPEAGADELFEMGAGAPVSDEVRSFSKLDKMAIAAFAAYHDLVSATHSVRRWDQIHEGERARWRAAADAAVMAESLLAPDGHVVLPLNAGPDA